MRPRAIGRTRTRLRRLRGLVENRLVEITTRTLQGRYLLRPSREVNQTILGVLGRGQRYTGLEICGFTFLSNHYHLLVVPESTEQLSEFMEFVNGNIARKVGRLHDWSGKFWDRRYHPIVVSDEPEAQLARLKYLLSQGVKEGLVRHPSEWPGVHCVDHLLGGYEEVKGGLWRDQTAEYYARRVGKVLKPEEFLFSEWVRLRCLPTWADWSRAERIETVRGLLREIQQIARHRRESTRKAPLGKRRIRQQAPHHRPERVSRAPAPAFHAFRKEHYEKLRERCRAFAEEYREAAERLKSGAVNVVFPAGCFPPRLPYVPLTRAGP